MTAYEKNRMITGGYNAPYKKDYEIAKLRRDFSIHFKDTPDFHPETKINDVVQPLIVSKYKSVITQKRIIAFPGQTFDRGDVVDCYGCKWLITDVDANDVVYTSGYMQQCQKEIFWQNPETKEIHSRWSTVEKPYFSNLEEDKRMSISTREFKIQMRYDSETNLLDVGKRLMLEVIGDKPKTYRITSIDSMTQRYEQDGDIKGFICINVEQDAYKPDTDNKDLMICDYVAPGETQPDTDITVTLTCKGGTQVRIGSSKTINATITGVTEDVVVVWQISSSMSESFYTVSENGNTVILNISDEMSIVGNTISVIATYDDKTANAEIEVVE